MKKYRIRYTKGEQVKFISHLDMLKVFSRAAIREDIPVYYSEGFNPHPDFVFGLPLAVGVTSDAEYVDTTLTEDWDPEKVMEKFNNTLPQGIRVTECKALEPGAGNIMASVTSSSYYVMCKLSSEGRDAQECFGLIKEVFDKHEPLIVAKRSKKGTKDVDIMPMIFDIQGEASENGLFRIYIVTSAGNEATLRPELAISGLSGACNVTAEIISIHRLSLNS